MRSKICVALFTFAAAALFAGPMVKAQAPPAGYLLDAYAQDPNPIPTYTAFNTSFTADNSSEYVSFAFRETPAYFAFDDPSVVLNSTTTNLLIDTQFQGSVDGQNCNHNNSLGCPVGWGAWIQPIDTSAIGQVASTGATYGCNVGAMTGTNFWCDGSVQGFDAIYQQLSGLIPGDVYNISFYLQDDSGGATMTGAPSCAVGGCIDMVVYAGDQLPVGTVNIGPPTPGTTPEPSSLLLLGTGLSGLVSALRIRRKLVA